MSEVVTLLPIIQVTANLEQYANRILGAQSINLIFSLIVTFYLTTTTTSMEWIFPHFHRFASSSFTLSDNSKLFQLGYKLLYTSSFFISINYRFNKMPKQSICLTPPIKKLNFSMFSYILIDKITASEYVFIVF